MLAAEIPGSVPIGLRAYVDLEFQFETAQLCINGLCLHSDAVHHEGWRVTLHPSGVSDSRWVCSVCQHEGGACT